MKVSPAKQRLFNLSLLNETERRQQMETAKHTSAGMCCSVDGDGGPSVYSLLREKTAGNLKEQQTSPVSKK